MEWAERRGGLRGDGGIYSQIVSGIRCVCGGVTLLVALFAAVASGVADDEVYCPTVPILRVVHEGDPVPGVPGATFTWLATPVIDAAGNVAIGAEIAGPGVDGTNDLGIWYGQPGALELVARTGQQAPDLAQGVVFSGIHPYLNCSETGCLVFTADLAGPGITTGVNDVAIYCGPPGDFRKVLQGGDPVPDIGPDVTVSATGSMAGGLTDNGTLYVGTDLEGPDLQSWQRAYWFGSRDELDLVLWEGMPVVGCPACAPGVTFDWIADLAFNDEGQISFNAGLVGPGVFSVNDRGRWIGSPGNWEIVHREGQPMPDYGYLASVAVANGVLQALNSPGDKMNRVKLSGIEITAQNCWVLLAGDPDPMVEVARTGNSVPEAGEGVYVASIGGARINDRRELLYYLRYAGPDIDDTNKYGVYFGPYSESRLIMRGGNPAPYFRAGSTLLRASIITAAAMNDVGDFAGQMDVLTDGDEVATLWLWHGVTQQAIPIVQVGTEIEGRVVTTTWYSSSTLGQYWDQTGGSDGMGQSFNDQRQLAVQLDFTDGTRGVYRIDAPLLGDTDGDGMVTEAELAAFRDCMAEGPGELAPGCSPLDLDRDADIDLRDYSLLQALLGAPR